MADDDEETTLLELPSIDLSSSSSATVLAAEIRKAHERFGFFSLVNHGVPAELLTQVLDLQSEFFAQSRESKSQFAVEPGYRKEGYNAAPFVTGTMINREHLYLFLRPLARRNPSKWPESHKDLIEELGDFSTEVYKKLIVALSQALDLDSEFALETLCHGDLKQTFAAFRYPIKDRNEEDVFGVAEHTDIGTLVLLFADDVPLLQVRMEDHKWYTVKPVPGSFIVSLGEVTEVMSNGIYRATPHRVILHEEKPRYSCAITFEPSERAQIAPARSLLCKNDPSTNYRSFTYGERYREYEEGKFLRRFAMLSTTTS